MCLFILCQSQALVQLVRYKIFDHQGSKLPKMLFLSFCCFSDSILSILSPSHLRSLSLSLFLSLSLSLHPLYPNAVMKIDVQVLISICFGMHTASLSIPDPPIS